MKSRALAGGTLAALGMALVLGTVAPAAAAPGDVGLGTAGAFGVLAGTAVTNTGPSLIAGDLGVSPGSAVTGFPPGLVLGVTHSADAAAQQAQADVTTAYNDAAGRATSSAITADLGGRTLTPGVYTGPTWPSRGPSPSTPWATRTPSSSSRAPAPSSQRRPATSCS
ncbi:MAG: putative sortase-sorted surface protein [Frankiales bacterium]|nr:putative sortase-sorted surface protein [Frankiales bacterium]